MPRTTKLRGAILAVWDSLPNLLTTINTYVDVGIIDSYFFKTTRIRFVAATNTLHVQILGSLDGGVTYPVTVVAQFNVTVATPVIQNITDYYTHFKVQTKPAVNDVHGTLSTNFAGASF